MDFVIFDIAKKLKEKGFKLACIGHYEGEMFEYNTYDGHDIDISYIARSYNDDSRFDEYTDVPVICQVLKWLREEKRIDAGTVWDNRYGKWVGYINEMDMPYLVGEYVLPNTHDTYEAATIASIEYVLDNLI